MTNIAKDLKNIVEKSVDPLLFPMQKGSKIFIGNCVIKYHDNCWNVYKEQNLQLTTETKTAAIAAARALRKNSSKIEEIKRLDRLINKNISDCIYYKNYLNSQTNQDTKVCASIRLEDSRLRIKDARDKLESFIFLMAK